MEKDWVNKGLASASDALRETARCCTADIEAAADLVVDSLKSGGKLLLCGNGGSAADAQHIAAEMSVKMKRVRSPLAAVALTTNSSLLTAQANDLGFETVFSRQIASLGREGDVLVAISTSGNSPNILKGVEAARETGVRVLGLTGCGGGKLAGMCDVAVIVPSDDVPRIQEVHIAVAHLICEYAESTLF